MFDEIVLQVVIVEQNKLCNGSGAEAMTVAQAIAIADRALVSTVQSLADAVVAPQLLHIVAGGSCAGVRTSLSASTGRIMLQHALGLLAAQHTQFVPNT